MNPQTHFKALVHLKLAYKISKSYGGKESTEALKFKKQLDILRETSIQIES
jgi:ascorbate-specific PTS system EIIC-type component UlaA